MSYRTKSISGFTLVELLIVISIIGLLVGVAIAGLTAARERGRIAAGIEFDDHNYHAFGAEQLMRAQFDEGSGVPNFESVMGIPVFGTDAEYTTDTPLSKGFGFKFLPNQSMSVSFNQPTQLNDFTVSVWVKPTSTNGFSLIAGRCTSVVSCPNQNGDNEWTRVFKMYVYASNPGDDPNRLTVLVGNEIVHIGAKEVLPVGKWSLVAYSYNKTAHTFGLYIDGHPVAKTVDSTPTPQDGYVDTWGTGDNWTEGNGIVDNFSIFPYSIEGN